MRFMALRRIFSGPRAPVHAILLAAFFSAGFALADASSDALTAISDAAEALANDDVSGFLDQFDSDMPNFAVLRAEVEGLLGASTVGSTVDVITSEGDDQSRALELDWVLMLSAKNSGTGGKETRRGVVKCRIARKGKSWKITAIEPVDFFRQ